MIGHGNSGAISHLVPHLFVGANATVVIIALGTLHRIAQGRLLPKGATTAPRQEHNIGPKGQAKHP